MGYDLSNQSGGPIRFTGSGWDLALAVARHYGWRPAGMPRPPQWDEAKYGQWKDECWINAGQEVTAGDAAALASALEQAAADRDVVRTIRLVQKELADGVDAVAGGMSRETSDDNAAGFRVRIIELANFAPRGPFVIE